MSNFLADFIDACMSDAERERYQHGRVPTAMLMAEVEAHYLDEWLRLATTPRPGRKTTSAKAARELCAVACVCLERNHPLPPALSAHLAQALRHGAEGRSVERALGLKRGAGQAKDEDPTNVAQHERGIAVWIFGKWNREGLSEAQAKESACSKFGLDTRRIEQIWQRYKPSKAGLDAMKEWKRGAAELAKREPQDQTGAAHRDWTMEVLEHSKRLL